MERAAAALHAAGAARWADAWRAFWGRVNAVESEAADALVDLWAEVPSEVLAVVSRGEPSAHFDALQDECGTVFVVWRRRLATESDEDPDAETPERAAWVRWWAQVGDVLPHPDNPAEPTDLSRWPPTVERPPMAYNLDGERAFYPARFSEAEPGSVEVWTAANVLQKLATVAVSGLHPAASGDGR